MDLKMKLQMNTPQVISEIIEGEVILIDLEMGFYYSLNRVGADIWRMVAQNATGEAIVETMLSRYEGDPRQIRREVTEMIQQMADAALLVEYVPEISGTIPENQAIEDNRDSGGDKIRFESPILEKYTDLQDLLLLDPIHEVDGSGWPHQE